MQRFKKRNNTRQQQNWMRNFLIILLLAFYGSMSAQGHDDHSGHNHDHSTHDHNHDHAAHAKGDHAKDDHAGHGCGHHEYAECTKGWKYDPAGTAMHHIADANAWHVVGNIYIPLPCILYAKGHGFSFFLSNKFDYSGNHGTGKKAVDRYILNHGQVMRITEDDFPMGVQDVCVVKDLDGHVTVNHHGKTYHAENKIVWDGGVIGGGGTSFYDFSISKNILTLLLAFFFLVFVFRKVAKGYATYEKQPPQGFWQRIIEPIFIFMRDDVCKPVIGPKYEKFMPFIMSLFFFILFLNLIGQVPFIGNPNVTGNIAFTMVLALFTLIVTTINGNKNYWAHVFWMPGVPAAVKLILTPIEVLGVFLKPLTLFVRLFANITAGHIVILSFVGLIFIFGDIGYCEWGIGRAGGSAIGMVMAVALTVFMSAIELLVAFLQAFIFAILSASYIGAAVEEGDHH